jgi:hypothetical protein
MRRFALRRLMLLLPFLAPLPAEASAEADAAFCTGLRRLVVAAAEGFVNIPGNTRLLPGSIEERRGVTRSPDGPPRAVVYAVMLRDNSRQHPNPADARYRALQGAIGHCLPDAEVLAASDRPTGATASWRTSSAVIGIRLDRGDAYLSNAEVEVSIASRW